MLTFDIIYEYSIWTGANASEMKLQLLSQVYVMHGWARLLLSQKEQGTEIPTVLIALMRGIS